MIAAVSKKGIKIFVPTETVAGVVTPTKDTGIIVTPTALKHSNTAAEYQTRLLPTR